MEKCINENDNYGIEKVKPEKKRNFIFKFIPGFRSNSRPKKIIALVGYAILFIYVFILILGEEKLTAYDRTLYLIRYISIILPLYIAVIKFGRIGQKIKTFTILAIAKEIGRIFLVTILSILIGIAIYGFGFYAQGTEYRQTHSILSSHHDNIFD